jgi:hypothetical protein
MPPAISWRGHKKNPKTKKKKTKQNKKKKKQQKKNNKKPPPNFRGDAQNYG